MFFTVLAVIFFGYIAVEPMCSPVREGLTPSTWRSSGHVTHALVVQSLPVTGWKSVGGNSVQINNPVYSHPSNVSRAVEKARSRVDEHARPHWVISKLEESVCYCPI
ncbi:hypothetical protein RRG08_026592 [Elysia crispata]|uniref:Secreted protein n=1 Tax=Elysia crispata TaxID=231223 RepID=A0AAE0XZL0_9GAST|nr:hypothetical protein RRG08_026592 [Elysia crispata]